jgi:dipeptidyl aminopeptidase/acylaminoacyl peptidase
MARTYSGLIWLALLVSGAHAEPPPAEVYGRLPAISDMAISPDGTKLVAGISIGDASLVRVLNLADGTTIAVARTRERQRLDAVGFAQDDIATFIVRQTLTRTQATPPGWQRTGGPRLFEYYRAGTVSLPGGDLNIMMENAEATWIDPGLADLIAPIEGDRGYGRMMTWTSFRPTALYGVFRVDLRTGVGGVVRQLPRDTWSLLLDRRGEWVARTQPTNPQADEWRLYVRDGEGERLLREESAKTGASPELGGQFPDGRIARLQYPIAGDRFVLAAINPADATGKIVFQQPKFDVGGIVRDPWTHEVVGANWLGDLAGEQQFFDAGLGAARLAVAGALGSAPQLRTWSQDRTKLIFFTETADDAGAYYLFDTQAKKLVRLGRTYPELPAANLGEVLAIAYPARDKTLIPAYLTVPPGKELKDLPLVVLVHGGPQARDSSAFDFWAQFLASRGYLVLQPNYRGSLGYGFRWVEAGFKQWGGLMQRDVEDGADALARSGYADKARTCIMGASYGGYAALAGATLTPERYACAVSVAGVTDLPRFLDWAADKYGDDGPALAFWSNTMGDRKTDRERLKAVSPAEHAQAVHIPVLLIHGTEDTVVPIEQTHLMHRRLRELGKDVRFVELAGDDHWLSYGATRTNMLAEIEKFLNEKMPAAPAERPVAALTPKLPPGFSLDVFEGSALVESGGTRGVAPLLDGLPKL